MAIYCAGCINRCPGCHNPQSWDMSNGRQMTIDELFAIVAADDMVDVTFTGGDPMLQASAFAKLARRIKSETNKTIWCYSGYTAEEILDHAQMRELLAAIDVLVDGRYVEALRDEKLNFRGSSNQRLIDAQATIKAGKAVLFDYNPHAALQRACK